MRIMILGGDGMFGHRLLSDFMGRHDVRATVRRPLQDYANLGLFTENNTISGLDARDTAALERAIKGHRPDLVINAIGVVKQRAETDDIVQNIEINALLPHRLAETCAGAGARLIHISTDCVFAGDRGQYTEDDVPDATDVYGQTKRLGEIANAGTITLRTSMIGLELSRKSSLVEWYLAQSGTIRGFTGAIYSGLTTMEFSRVLLMLADRFPTLSGIYHVVAEPISKYDLLSRLNTLLDRTDLQIEAETNFRCDRSLRGDRFERATGYRAPAWDVMLGELAEEIRNREAA